MTPSFFATLPLGWSIYVVIVWLAVLVLIALNVVLVLPVLVHESWAWMHEHLRSPSSAVQDSCLGPEGTSPSEDPRLRRQAAANVDLESRRRQLNAAYLAGRR